MASKAPSRDNQASDGYADGTAHILEEQLSKKTDLRVVVDGVRTEFDENNAFLGSNKIRFSVHNGGNKSADGFYWEILFDEDLVNRMNFMNEKGHAVPIKISHQSETETYFKVDGHYTHKLFPYSGIEVACLFVDRQDRALDAFYVRWRIRGEDGMVPPTGLATLKFKRQNDTSYTWTRWHPGQDTDAIKMN